ncbi:TOBE domain-containing protein [Mesorhizobium silamurunense]|uniref:TOBE domain-containing protein n=1 Tax=Mesorhizobium silamurunense TaxID=499528 RepID=UPI001AEE32D4|nr:TOBE domain-containing protein [Mesorhizobium silamurunense]
MSNLDARLRVEMRHEIRQLQQRIGATILFVTHDQEEARSLADEIFLFNNGKVEQQGSPEDLYFHPAARYVAEFLGKANLFPVTLRGEGEETAIYAAGSDYLITKGDIVRQSRGDEALCMIRPECWQIGPAEGDCVGLPATVVEAVFVGDRRELHVDTRIGPQTVVIPALLCRRSSLFNDRPAADSSAARSSLATDCRATTRGRCLADSEPSNHPREEP